MNRVTPDQRIRRVALLCCHFTRNLAYFRAGWDILRPRDEGEFWITVIGNFIDVCALEWGKLFGDHDGKHHWKQIIDDGDSFKKSLMTEVGISQEQWDACWKEIKEYRDKFIAHLDSELTMNVPKMEIPQRMVAFYFDRLSAQCSHPTVMNGLPSDMREYYRRHHSEAAEVFRHNKAHQSTDQHKGRG